MLSERNAPTPSKDGKAMYTYGVGLPTVVCSPLHVCALELQAGEKLMGEPLLGDAVRWQVLPMTSGDAESAVPVIAIKPLMPGQDTTMLLATSRRMYYVRLVSDTQQYMARTGFVYPEEPEVQWKAFLERQEREKREKEEESPTATLSRGGFEKLNFRYLIQGNGPETMRPTRVFDDGAKTYIQMPDEAEHTELPALVVVVGKVQELVNFRVKNNVYIVDRLFSRGALLIGTGKAQRLFWIVRQGGPHNDAE